MVGFSNCKKSVLTQRFVPDIGIDGRFDARLQDEHRLGKVLGLHAGRDRGDPRLLEQRPVGVHVGGLHVGFQLQHRLPQRVDQQGPRAVHGAGPLEFGRLRERKLVGEVAFFVTLLVALRLGEGARNGGIVVHVVLETALHAQFEEVRARGYLVRLESRHTLPFGRGAVGGRCSPPQVLHVEGSRRQASSLRTSYDHMFACK
jgi:hypothetical protein